MNSRDTGCLGVVAALALSALAGDAAADEAATAHASAAPGARPRSAQLAHTKARPRAQLALAATSRPQVAHTTGAPTRLDGALSPLMPPLLTPVVPLASVPRTVALPDAERSGAALREQHRREAPEVPAPGAHPVRATSDEAPDHATGDEHALEVAGRLLGDGVPLQLLQSVIVPAARGVTIAEIQTEGEAAVTLSVRPTKITRGSGLVAVGRF